MKVTVLFFGVLSEVAETDCKVYAEVRSLEDLLHRIADDYPSVSNYSFRISLNNELTDGDQRLSDGDEVALLPPFAGG